eukprot:scaffold1168_cov167-Amphora_coffeaeformis.AAC.34
MRTKGSARFSHPKDNKIALQNVADDSKFVRLARPIKSTEGKRMAEARQPSGRTTPRFEGDVTTSGRVGSPSAIKNKQWNRKKKGSVRRNSAEQGEIQRFGTGTQPTRPSSPLPRADSYPESILKKFPRRASVSSIHVTENAHEPETIATTQRESALSTSQEARQDVNVVSQSTLGNEGCSDWLLGAFSQFQNAFGFNLCSPTEQPALPTTSASTPASSTPLDPETNSFMGRSLSMPYITHGMTADDINEHTSHYPRSFKTASVQNAAYEEEQEILKSFSLDTNLFGRSFNADPYVAFTPIQVKSTSTANGLGEEREMPKLTEAEAYKAEMAAREIRGAASRDYKTYFNNRKMETDLPLPGIRRVTSDESFGWINRTSDFRNLRRVRSQEDFSKKKEGNDSDLRYVSDKVEKKPRRNSKKSAQEIRQMMDLVMDLTRETACRREVRTHPTRVVRVLTKSDTAKKHQNGVRNCLKTSYVGQSPAKKRGFV